MEIKKRLTLLNIFLCVNFIFIAQVRYGNDFNTNMYGYLPIKDTLSEAGIIIDLKEEHFIINRIGVNAEYFSDILPICRFNIYEVTGESFIKIDSFKLSTLPSRTSSTLEVELDSGIVITGKILITIVSLCGNKDHQYIEFPYKINYKPTLVRSAGIAWKKTRLITLPIWVDLKKL